MKDIGQQFVLYGKVYLVTLAGPVEIKRMIYQEEPPVLDQCPGCSQAVIYGVNPDPSTCAIAKDVRTEFVLCRVAIGRPYEPGVCNVYKNGIPERPQSLLRCESCTPKTEKHLKSISSVAGGCRPSIVKGK